MIFQIIYAVTFIFLLIYLFYLRLFYVGLKNRNVNFVNSKPFVSIVIAARNEEKNIARLLTTLVNQTYQSDRFQIIIANDGSNDETASIVDRFSQKWDKIKLLNVTGREKAISPKKNALSQAIEMAEGEIILSTDADCLVGQYWIESMVACFNDNEMVIGFSRTKLVDWSNADFIRKFEHFDFLAMLFAAAGAISSGKYFSCSGQNIAYKKEAFYKVGGFEKIKHLISGDDVNLMQLFRKSGMKVNFAFTDHSYVYTKPIDNIGKFLSQRSRWTSNMKWQILLNPEFFVYLLSVFFITFLPIVILFNFWQLGVGVLLLRMIFELIFLKYGYEVFGENKKKLIFYPVWFFIQPFYIIVIALMGGLNLFSWKK
ncbi:MAG: glycosyltransferase [Candidatus Cloacimonadota bacterium]|nr:glycosyltransferase [Candidatus Cloacimonadota bacterium]